MFVTKPQSGFTIIELLVVIAIFVIISGFALFLSMDFYRTYASNAERGTVVSSLTKARNRAMANINQNEHGVRVSNNSYTIFQGSTPLTYDLHDITKDEIIPSGSNSTVPGNIDIIFKQLSGKTSCSPTCSIDLTSQDKHKPITINSEGGIEW